MYNRHDTLSSQSQKASLLYRFTDNTDYTDSIMSELFSSAKFPRLNPFISYFKIKQGRHFKTNPVLFIYTNTVKVILLLIFI